MYLLSELLVMTGEGLLTDLTPYTEVILTAPGEIASEHEWVVPHTLSSFDSGVDARTSQIYQTQPGPADVSQGTTSTLNFQTSANYSWSHHLDP
jgi:hypothetical protein